MIRKVTIDVTASHIRRGKRQAFQACPIALAARKVLRQTVIVTEDDLTVGDVTIRLPAAAMRFIARFDERRPVEPFSFKLRIPDEN